MRIGCLQFTPLPGEVSHNLSRADSVLLRADPEELDLLVLPELAFVGQGSNSLNDIYPFLEPSGSGVTSMWARTVALKYGCTVVAGYAEKVDARPKWMGRPEYYNSTIAVNYNGETVGHYRKCHLQPSEEAWALEGPNPFHGDWLPELGQVAIGTSMDINPYKFQDQWENLDFAFHIMEVRANLVIVTMAWPTHQDPQKFSQAPLDPDTNTLMYWISRLEPIIRNESEDEVIVVFCNKCGIEGPNCFAGTSAVLGVSAGEVRVYGILGRGTKELLVVDTEMASLGRLVSRPDFDFRKEREAQMRAFMLPSLFRSIDLGANVAYSANLRNLLNTMNIDSPAHSQSRFNTLKNGLPSLKTTDDFLHNTRATPMGGMDLSMVEPNILTPSAPSPTPHGSRPRFMIPPIESITQRYIVSQSAQSTAGYRHVPTPIPPNQDIHPRVLSGDHDVIIPDTSTIETPHLFSLYPPQVVDFVNEPNGGTYPLSASSSEATAFSEWIDSDLNSQISFEGSARVISGSNMRKWGTHLLDKTNRLTPHTSYDYMTQMAYRAPPSPPTHNSYTDSGRRRASPIRIRSHLRSRSGSARGDNYIPRRQPTPIDTYADTLLANHLAKMSRQDINTLSILGPKNARKTNRFSRTNQHRPRSASAPWIAESEEEYLDTRDRSMTPRGRHLERPAEKRNVSSGRGQSGSNHRSAVQSRNRSTSQPVDLTQFKVVEEFPCPNCPVHGIAARERARRSASTSQQQLQDKGSKTRSSSANNRRLLLNSEFSASQKHCNRPSSAGATFYDHVKQNQQTMASMQSVLPRTTTPTVNRGTPNLTAPILELHELPQTPWVETWMPPISKSVPPTSITHDNNLTNSRISTTPPPQDGRATPRAMVILFDEENTNWADEGGSRPLKCVERSGSVDQYYRKSQVV